MRSFIYSWYKIFLTLKKQSIIFHTTKFVLKINTLCHNNFCHYLVFLRIHNYSKQRKFCWQEISSTHRHYDNTHSIGGHTHTYFLGLGTEWRGTRDLSRHHHWRDKPTLSRHCQPNTSRDCIFYLLARQVPFVAPLLMARQEKNSALLLTLAAACFWCCGRHSG